MISLAFFAAAPSAQAASPENALDARAWELVSPLDKNGGEVASPGAQGAGAFQAAAAGGALAYASAASFGQALGAPPLSQYLASRAAAAWAGANLSPPLLSGTYSGGAYQLFSVDLSRAVLSGGWSCRDASPPCPAENPPLAAGAPAGYRNLYLRQGSAYTPLITTADSPSLTVPAADFQLSLAGAAPDLGHILISTCAALTANATEVPSGGGGCEPAAQNLYEWSAGTLTALNILPGQSQSTPGAALAAPSGAISDDGSRVYFSAEPVPGERNLYLRHAGLSAQLDATQGGGGSFQAASADGTLAFFTKSGHLYRYDALAQTATDLTPLGGVQGVLAASAAGDFVYYQDASALRVWHSGATSTVAPAAAAAAPSDYPPAIATARLSADGQTLAFLSTAKLTSYENAAHSELYVYGAGSGQLLCASCRPSGAAPTGSASIPAALAAGEGPPAYRPRALSADGRRLFFDSTDRLFNTDTDGAPDVYQWQAPGSGGCAKAGGCLGFISSGRVSSASFLDASADGTDAYFLTAASLLPADLGSADVYDARAGGGYPEPPAGLPCEGDDCQGPPGAPDDPAPGTAVFEGLGNPPVHYPKVHKKHHQRKKHHSHRGHRRGARS